MKVGEISSTEDGNFQWTIRYFQSFWGATWCLTSPTFGYNGLKYYVELIKVSRSLIRVSFTSNILIPSNFIYVPFKICTDSNAESQSPVYASRSYEKSQRNSVSAILDFEGFLSRDLLSLLPQHLTIQFWMKEQNAVKKLQNDFEKLFLSKEDCDVTLKVQQEEFLAHRAILRARSPVFYAMFSHKMLETRSGVVTISDCDPKIFPDFLMYLYTGKTQHISEKNVCHLYMVSDKYEVEELKVKCSEFMKSHMSVEKFCDFISLALKHADKKLICAATEFFCRSAVEIIKTAKWQRFLQDNSTVGNELFQKALLKQNNI